MAITCEWKHELGKAKVNGIKVVMYTGGNCTACICTPKNHCLQDFICDIDHLKRILGDDGGHWKTDYTNIQLNGFYNEAWKVAKELNKHGIKITMYRKEVKK